MSGDTTVQSLKRLTWLPERDSSDNGNLIAGQDYFDVFFSGGEISNVTLTNVTLTNPSFSSPVTIGDGGTGASLVAPAGDRIFFYDQSAGASDWLIPGSGLVITDKTITVSGVGLGDVTGPMSSTDNAITRYDGTTGKIIQNSGASIDDTGNITANNFSGTSSGTNTGDQTITLTGNVTGSGKGSFATTIANGVVSNTMFRNSTNLSVVGRNVNSSGSVADIAAGSDHQVLRRSGTSLGFGQVNLAQSAAVTGTLPPANGGTGATSTPTNGQLLIGNGTGYVAATLTASGGVTITNGAGTITLGDAFGSKLLHLQDQKSAGTDGGTATSGSWQTRTLNTEVTDEIGSILLSNQFDLPAGTYFTMSSAPARSVNNHQARLYNVTDASVVLYGTAEETASSLSFTTQSLINGRFTIASTKTFRLEHRVSNTQATNGYGSANGFGNTQIYSDVKIWKVL